MRNTIRGNRTDKSPGGGLAIEEQPKSGLAVIQRTTLSGNDAGADDGDAFYAVNWSKTFLESSTLTGPTNAVDTRAFGSSETVLQVHGSIIGGGCSEGGTGTTRIESAGDNLEARTGCNFNEVSDKQGPPSLSLAELGDVGAEVQLRVPQLGSPALDRGDCKSADGWTMPERPFGGTTPQDAPEFSPPADGTYECDRGAAERQHVQVSLGSNNPGDKTVSAGNSGVVMAQLALANEAGNGMNGRTLEVAHAGSGDAAMDVSSVEAYVDADDDGELDDGETQIDTGSYSGSDDTVALDLTKAAKSPLVASDATVNLLVVYDFSTSLSQGPLAPRMPSADTVRTSGIGAGVGVGAGLVLLPLLGVRGRRRRLLGVAAVALVASAALTARGGGGGGGGGGGNNGGDGGRDDTVTKTFVATVEGVTVEEAGSSMRFALRFASTQGNTVSVED